MTIVKKNGKSVKKGKMAVNLDYLPKHLTRYFLSETRWYVNHRLNLLMAIVALSISSHYPGRGFTIFIISINKFTATEAVFTTCEIM